MGWAELIWAGLLAAMLIMLFPRAKHMVENSPKGTMKDWMGFIVPMAAVILFIIVLISLV
ncbi:MAG: hypothetical protein GY875_17220 [Gammaproteobacteria bacterium]|nr:hypothetical protein [Gammaproteobacteria bacterium]